MTYEGLNFTTTEINNDFRIKISGVRNGTKYNTLVGVSGLLKIVGVDLANKIIAKAINTLDEKSERKLRTGLKVTFYVK
jgi:hypothetical protein